MESSDCLTEKGILIAGLWEHTANYRRALNRLRCPFRVSLDPENNRAAALLLPGGGDMDPSLYGEAGRGSRNVRRELDLAQLALLNAFVQEKKPVLGICRGMQVINVYFGGTLIQDLPTACLHLAPGDDLVHSCLARPGTLLSTLYGKTFPVNSAHHQGIGRPGQSLSVIAQATDGVAEALLHNTLPIMGVQWHPERMCFDRKRPDTVDGSLLLRRFLSLLSEKNS